MGAITESGILLVLGYICIIASICLSYHFNSNAILVIGISIGICLLIGPYIYSNIMLGNYVWILVSIGYMCIIASICLSCHFNSIVILVIGISIGICLFIGTDIFSNKQIKEDQQSESFNSNACTMLAHNLSSHGTIIIDEN